MKLSPFYLQLLYDDLDGFVYNDDNYTQFMLYQVISFFLFQKTRLCQRKVTVPQSHSYLSDLLTFILFIMNLLFTNSN